MWDAHCHLDDPRCDGQRDAILERANLAGVEGMIIAGYAPHRWPIQQALAQRYPNIYLAFGLHPWVVADEAHTDDAIATMLQQLEASLHTSLKTSRALPAPPAPPLHVANADVTPRASQVDLGAEIADPALFASRKLVGLGELGLDQSKRCPAATWGRQVRIFRKQLALARDEELPVVLHVVQAHGPMLDILRADGLPKAGGMVHGFTGAPGLAQAYTQAGLHISLGGQLTYEYAHKARQTAATLDSAWLLCETDAPDMPPQLVHTSRALNEPANLPVIIAQVAQLRRQSQQEIGALTSANTKQLFGIK